jgi:hypothetical protein
MPQEARNYALANPDMSPSDVVVNLAAKGIAVNEKQVSNFFYNLSKGERETRTKNGGPGEMPAKKAKRKYRRKPEPETTMVGTVNVEDLTAAIDGVVKGIVATVLARVRDRVREELKGVL